MIINGNKKLAYTIVFKIKLFGFGFKRVKSNPFKHFYFWGAIPNFFFKFWGKSMTIETITKYATLTWGLLLLATIVFVMSEGWLILK